VAGVIFYFHNGNGYSASYLCGIFLEKRRGDSTRDCTRYLAAHMAQVPRV